MKTAVWLDYKPTRYEGKCFLRNLNLRIHRDITGDRCGLGWGGGSDLFINSAKQMIRHFSIKLL